MIAALDPTPAVLHGPRLEVLAINCAGRLLIHDFDALPESERNMVRWMFTDARAKQVYPDWGLMASAAFAKLWADQRLFQHTHGPKRFHHESIGTLTVNYETVHLPADPGLSLILYTADAGSPSEAKLRELLTP